LRHLLTERYRERLAGVLSCYDRIIVTGTLPGAWYAQGMTAFLSARQIRIFDYPRFAEPLRARVRDRAAELAHAAGVTILTGDVGSRSKQSMRSALVSANRRGSEGGSLREAARQEN
jgi:hypothetical protein